MEKTAKSKTSQSAPADSCAVPVKPVKPVTLEATESDSAVPAYSDASSASMPTDTTSSSMPMDTSPASMPMDTSSSATPCGVQRGKLPGKCAPMAFPYVPVQDNNPVRYSRMEALETGTLFPGLNLPFKAAIQRRTQLNNTALVELMALDFAIQELGLYLTTHAHDQEALQLYWSYVQLSKEGREKYQSMYGPLMETDLTPEDGFVWLNDPWPWDLGGNA